MLSYYGFGGGLNYFMASKEDVNQEDGEGDATLFHAGPFGNTRVADLLLRAGADIDNINNNENKVSTLITAIFFCNCCYLAETV